MSLIVQGAPIYLAERGAGSPTLFLHGNPDSAEMWNDIIARIADRYRCFAPDLPGMGRSEAPAGFDFSLESMARFTGDLIAAAGIPTPLNLVVTDFGGPYGLTWAITQPEKVRRIVIAGGVTFSPDYRWHPAARQLRTPVLGDMLMALLTPALFERSMRPNAPNLSAEHWHQVYALSYAKRSVRRTALRMYRTLDPRDYAGWYERLTVLITTVPTLVLWGDKDPFIAPTYAERFGSARVEHFPDNGHWLALEAPEVVADRIATFCAE